MVIKKWRDPKIVISISTNKNGKKHHTIHEWSELSIAPFESTCSTATPATTTKTTETRVNNSQVSNLVWIALTLTFEYKKLEA
jgi:hypothetical protein